jgi:hypothetical protein
VEFNNLNRTHSLLKFHQFRVVGVVVTTGHSVRMRWRLSRADFIRQGKRERVGDRDTQKNREIMKKVS